MLTLPDGQLTQKQILRFWLPLLSTWLMMSVEGPFLTAVIARLAEPTFNLAAYGVAFAFALLIESPIIMMMSASTALASNRTAYLRLWRFTATLNAIITSVMIALLIPPFFDAVMLGLIALPTDVASRTHLALAILLPWPAAIGFRRFYQGLLIRNNRTRRVAYGTVIRVCSMATTAFTLAQFTDVEGVVVGTASLSVAVIMEALASRWMAHRFVRQTLRIDGEDSQTLTYRAIIHFYMPLAFTSIIALGIHPMITFFVGRSRMAIESLAVLPVINALVFIFRSIGLSFQEVGIALFGKDFQHYEQLLRFAMNLAWIAAGALLVIAWSPLASIWFEDVSGLTPALAEFARLPLLILAVIPATTVWISFQRAVLINSKTTAPITIATTLEVSSAVLTLAICIGWFDMVGAAAAAIALITGRLVANVFLTRPHRYATSRRTL